MTKTAHQLHQVFAATLTCLLIVSFTPLVRAQAAAQSSSCEPLERALASAQSELERERDRLNAARVLTSEVDAVRARAEQAERERDNLGASLDSCQSAKDSLCAAAGGFANGILAGRVNAGGVAACVEAPVMRGLAEQLSGWSNATATLARLGAFSTGEIDVSPGVGASSGSRAEKLIARLFAQGNGSPQIYRRLLIEALRLVAPRSLAGLRAHAGGLDRWFLGRDSFGPGLVAELAGGEPTRVGEARTPALATATGLVDSYQLIAGCYSAQPARDCWRAEQLSRLLESSGPLITRRRVQDIWASECSSLTREDVRAWLTGLPMMTAESDARFLTVAEAARSKLFACFLRDATTAESIHDWLPAKLSPLTTGTNRVTNAALELESWWKRGSPADACARAVRALQAAPLQNQCAAPASLVSAIGAWVATRKGAEAPRDFNFEMCDRLGLALWRGESVSILDGYPAPPTVDDVVQARGDGPRSNIARLRDSCAARVGSGVAFEAAIGQLGRLASGLGESVSQPPWSLTSDLSPVEKRRTRRGSGTATWLRSVTQPTLACEILELTSERCTECRKLPDGSHYDCALAQQMRASWAGVTRRTLLVGLGVAGSCFAAIWILRLRRALVLQRPWREQSSGFLRRLGLQRERARWHFLIPARVGDIEFTLPHAPLWERYGRRAVLVRCEAGSFRARDVERAALAARAASSELAVLVHDDAVSPDLAAVRAMLDWAARGPGKGVHIAPLMWSRLAWAQDTRELLELAEESSLRSNPFEVRGRVTSSTQFFDRERLVSGLLANVQAGRFTVVTGLRRFGKSSLALEVLRRLPGPAAYVDLSGFYYEIHGSEDPTRAADAILRYLCLELLESARARHPGKALDLAEPSAASIDAAALATWLREFDRALTKLESGRAPPALMILDELEHAIGASPALSRALDVLAIVVGRLRNALHVDNASRGQRVGVLFCSALHPLLWSPLGTLAHQSLIASFEQVAVPCLPADAAAAMMRALGARQGIRFSPVALDLLVAQSQGVPLLLRRLGTAVLELYDPERARQGGLGAIEIGAEGALAAVEREVSDGSPVRVWVESEMAAQDSPGGAVLRLLAQQERGMASQLRRVATEAFLAQFQSTGLASELTPGEGSRRAEEAAAVVVRTLGESGLLIADGDPTEPEAYLLPDGVIRRALRAAAN